MANNRLYIRDRATGRRFFLARTLGTRWLLACSSAELQEWLDGFDRCSEGRHRGAPADLLALDDDAEHFTQLELFDDKSNAAGHEHTEPFAALAGLNLWRDIAMRRLRRALEDVFESARTIEEHHDLATLVEEECMHCDLSRMSAIERAQQETQPLSTESLRSDASCADAALDDAPRSGALEPEETTDGPQRRGS